MIREAASIILLRRIAVGAGFEVFLVRRHRGSSFMASAYVFPGGAAEEGEDARTAAARELFEEAGVLLARQSEDRDSETLELMSQAAMRKDVLEGAKARSVLAAAGLQFSTENLVPWSHWITPSIEPKRFSARFFICELPTGQEPQFDATETVDQAWVTPEAALARASELQLPPPQIRTFWELAQLESISKVIAAGRARAEQPHPIMPRLMPGTAPALLLPWDPEYLTKGTGESTPLTYQPAWATGPSRFILDGKSWKHVAAPGSTSAGS
ncbi:MAG TPA: NUDIX hydrolase [Kofleriaceae bacterium]|nr:NUDIX hydrolase [Kofleriaceae bacterium]